MKTKVVLALFVSLLTLHACQTDNRQNSQNNKAEVNTKKETPTKLIEALVGEWQKDASGAPPSQANGQEKKVDRMIFTQEARYMQYSGGQTVDSGAYRMNEQLRNLYLDSESNAQAREFEIDLQDNRMTLKPKSGNQSGDQAETYRKISSATSP